MTAKIKLTAEQGKAMDDLLRVIHSGINQALKTKGDALNYHVTGLGFAESRKAVDTLTVGELATALYVGYEVEHELDKEVKLGQFVYIDGELNMVARLNDKFGIVSLKNGNAWSKAYETLGLVTYALKKDSEHWEVKLVPNDNVEITVTD